VTLYSDCDAPDFMEPKELADKIFAADARIRYVAVVGPGPEYALLESCMREGIKSLTPDKTDREFFGFTPLLILGAAEKMEKELGSITYSVIRYERVMLVFFKTSNYTVALSVEPTITASQLYECIKRFLPP